MNFGMTHFVIHSALAAFLPPSIALAAIVSVYSLTSALRSMFVVPLLPRQPPAATTATRPTAAAAHAEPRRICASPYRTKRVDPTLTWRSVEVHMVKRATRRLRYPVADRVGATIGRSGSGRRGLRWIRT